MYVFNSSCVRVQEQIIKPTRVITRKIVPNCSYDASVQSYLTTSGNEDTEDKVDDEDEDDCAFAAWRFANSTCVFNIPQTFSTAMAYDGVAVVDLNICSAVSSAHIS